ncbi:MAG TPA: tripartite tricarboxylate transporter substrate-binding protein, partial [Eoetvoesiella sp.]
ARMVAERPADGYSLLMVNSSYAVNPGVFSKMPFDPKKDFDAIINFAYVPSILVTHPDSPYKTLGDVTKAGAPTDNQVSYGSCGNGTPQHLAGEMLNISAKTHIQHVPYKGCGPLLTDVLGQQIAMGYVTASSAMPHIKAGKLRALGTTAKERSTLLPDVATIAEQGYPGYELNQWHGLLTPSGTPDAIKTKLYESVTKIVARPDIQKRLADLGYSAANDGPAAFQKIVHDDIDRFAAISKQIGLKVD